MGKKRTKGKRGETAGPVIILGSVILLIVSIIGLIGALPAYVHDQSVRGHGVPATGVVTEVVEFTTHTRHSSTENYFPIVSTSIDGVSATTRMRPYNVERADEWAVGERVPVVYDSRDPSRVVPGWPGAERDLTISFWFIAGLGIVSVVAGGVVFVVRAWRSAVSND